MPARRRSFSLVLLAVTAGALAHAAPPAPPIATSLPPPTAPAPPPLPAPVVLPDVAAIPAAFATFAPSTHATGLPWRVDVRADLFKLGSAAPVASAAARCRVTFDLWDGRYAVQVTGANGAAKAMAADLTQAARACIATAPLASAEADLHTKRAASIVTLLVAPAP